jgi:hypothetical protein
VDRHVLMTLTSEPFQAESASLRFGGGYEDVPRERRPVILGRIRFPTNTRMVLQTNSVAREIVGARLLHRTSGPRA